MTQNSRSDPSHGKAVLKALVAVFPDLAQRASVGQIEYISTSPIVAAGGGRNEQLREAGENNLEPSAKNNNNLSVNIFCFKNIKEWGAGEAGPFFKACVASFTGEVFFERLPTTPSEVASLLVGEEDAEGNAKLPGKTKKALPDWVQWTIDSIAPTVTPEEKLRQNHQIISLESYDDHYNHFVDGDYCIVGIGAVSSTAPTSTTAAALVDEKKHIDLVSSLLRFPVPSVGGGGRNESCTSGLRTPSATTTPSGSEKVEVTQLFLAGHALFSEFDMPWIPKTTTTAAGDGTAETAATSSPEGPSTFPGLYLCGVIANPRLHGRGLAGMYVRSGLEKYRDSRALVVSARTQNPWVLRLVKSALRSLDSDDDKPKNSKEEVEEVAPEGGGKSAAAAAAAVYCFPDDLPFNGTSSPPSASSSSTAGNEFLLGGYRTPHQLAAQVRAVYPPSASCAPELPEGGYDDGTSHCYLPDAMICRSAYPSFRQKALCGGNAYGSRPGSEGVKMSPSSPTAVKLLSLGLVPERGDAVLLIATRRLPK